MTEDQDQQQFFTDLGATAEQTVEEVRGVEENYFVLLQKMLTPLPWIADLNKKLQNYAAQNFADALEFSHELSHAKDLQDLTRLNVEFIQKRVQSVGEQAKDFAEAYTKLAGSATKVAFDLSS